MPDVLLDRTTTASALVTLNRPDSLNAMGGTLMAELGDTLQRLERRRTSASSPSPARPRLLRRRRHGRVRAARRRRRPKSEDARAGEPARRASARSSGRTGPRSVAAPRRPQAPHDAQADRRARQRRGRRRGHDPRALVRHPSVSDKAKFVPAFARIAFSGDYGGSYFLTKLVGPGAREIYFTGEHIDAQRALSWASRTSHPSRQPDRRRNGVLREDRVRSPGRSRADEGELPARGTRARRRSARREAFWMTLSGGRKTTAKASARSSRSATRTSRRLTPFVRRSPA